MAVAISTFQDQLGWFLTVPQPVSRIVSLVPSQTEFLCDLGLEEKIVGITKFCIHPESCYRNKIHIGGTKNFDIESIRLLNPDIIIANKEENEQEQIMKLKTMFPVWISDVRTYAQALDMMKQLGAVLGKAEKADEIVRKVQHNMAHIKQVKRRLRALYFIWRKPYMTVNGDTFIHSMMERIGLENVYAQHKARYPKVTEAELRSLKPDVILLSSEPYPFRERHLVEMQAVYPGARIFLVDGEMFSWYGSRLIQAPTYFNRLLLRLGKVSQSV